ncbi:unnamed protein product [Paramecium octaurelia]|uniref:Uncharacterized protein n=1 Tax=Paramecium octaurelia TaxID=43137 RepID=A0A8S1S399_PAROT|nr:unnamed protein product [Paramecium octaurelia]
MKTKLYDFYRREILHMYGTQHIMTLENCEKQVQLEKNLMILIYGKKLKNLCVINEDMLIMMLQKIFYMFFLRLLQQCIFYLLMRVRIFAKNTWGPLVLQALKELPWRSCNTIKFKSTQRRRSQGRSKLNLCHLHSRRDYIWRNSSNTLKKILKFVQPIQSMEINQFKR